MPTDKFYEGLVTKALKRMYLVTSANIDYEPDPSQSVLALSQSRNVPAMQLIVDHMLTNGGKGMIYSPFFNYMYGDLSMTYELMQHPQTRNGLSDAGAHCGAICDGGMPTFMLTHWTRDRKRGPKMPLAAAVRALTSDDVGGDAERDLTDHARTLVPALPFPQIDVLIVDRGGKDISGTTMDPNVTGRFWVHGLGDLSDPDVSTIVLLDVTDISGGNVLGIGFADFIPLSLAQKIDFRKTYINCFTAGIAGVRRSRMPMVLPTEDDCMKAALSMCGRGFDEPKRVVRITSTLHLTRAWVSDEVLRDLPPGVKLA